MFLLAVANGETIDMGTPGKLYLPSNGTEGEWFMERHCYRCPRDTYDGATGEGESCPILLAALICEPGGEDQPREWVYGPDGRPTCTAFDTEPRQPDAPGQMRMFGGEG